MTGTGAVGELVNKSLQQVRAENRQFPSKNRILRPIDIDVQLILLGALETSQICLCRLSPFCSAAQKLHTAFIAVFMPYCERASRTPSDTPLEASPESFWSNSRVLFFSGAKAAAALAFATMAGAASRRYCAFRHMEGECAR